MFHSALPLSTEPKSPMATLYNTSGGIHSRSFNKTIGLSPHTETNKQIEIWPRGWPQYRENPIICER